MADDGKKGAGKSVKNIYDRYCGLGIMANLYTIKYLYYHVEKADRFIMGRSGRKKAVPLYSTDMFPISRQRLDRINKGERFELTRREAALLTDTYGIDGQHFRKEKPVRFKMKGIDDDDWKCFYNNRHEGMYELPQDVAGEAKERAGRVEGALKELAASWEKELDKRSPLFAVCYYFRYGERFDRLDVADELQGILKGIDFREWEKKDDKVLREVRDIMKEHLSYMESILRIRKLRDKK